MQSLYEGAQAARIEFLIALLNPCLSRFAAGEDDLAYEAEVLFGMKPVENLNRLGK
jgi:hypothetical protein